MLGFLVSWLIGVRTYLLIPRWETNQLGFHKWCLTPIYSRDLAALSLIAAPCVALLLYVLEFGFGVSASAALILLTQYSATAVAARNNGMRFVTNVLALHSLKKIA
jgi:hypothetical protein